MKELFPRRGSFSFELVLKVSGSEEPDGILMPLRGPPEGDRVEVSTYAHAAEFSKTVAAVTT